MFFLCFGIRGVTSLWLRLITLVINCGKKGIKNQTPQPILLSDSKITAKHQDCDKLT